MPIGVTMIKSANSYYSPIFGRGGQKASFSIEVLNLEGSATLDVTVQHKNSADVSWTTLTSFTQFTGTGTDTEVIASIKEQLRFKYDVGGNAGDFVHVFVFSPVWQD